MPLAGRIVASAPVEAWADGSGNTLEVAPAMLGNNPPAEVFALTVQGDSMIDAMIADGDNRAAAPRRNRRQRELVAVCWPTRKPPRSSASSLRASVCAPARKPTMDPIYVDAAQCRVQGKVVAVIRHSH